MVIETPLPSPQDSGMITEIATPALWVEWLTGYLAREEASARPLTTRKLRSYHIRRFAQEVGGHPSEVTEDQITKHYTRTDWQPGYRRSVLGSLRSFYRWARRAGLISHDPAETAPSTPLCGTSRCGKRS